MTTIAVKDGVIAGDGRVLCGDHIFSENTEKVFCLSSGAIIGHSGRLKDLHIINDFLNEERQEIPKVVDAQGIYVSLGGDIFEFEVSEGEIFYHEIDTSFTSVGSGCEYAIGAMAQGASAEEAVKIASRFDSGTNSNVFKLDF